MGQRCLDTGCPYLADDGTCLLPEHELKEKCKARERVGHEEREDWIDENYIGERLGSLRISQGKHKGRG